MTAFFPIISPYILAFFRIGAFLTACPLLMMRSAPYKIKWFITLIMSVLLIDDTVLPIMTNLSIILAIVSEVLLGLMLALSLQLCLAALNLSGNLIDTQMGLNARSLFDAHTSSADSVIAKVFTLLATSLFFYWNLHLTLWQGFKTVFQLIPLGSMLYILKTKSLVLSAESLFVFGLMFAAPIVLALWLLDVLLAMVVKTLPQVNVFFIGLPIKILAGIALISFSLNSITPLLYQHFLNGYNFWQQLV